MNPDQISRLLNENHIAYQPELVNKIDVYLKMLLEWNSRMDLTAVAEENEMFDRHYADSLSVLRTQMIFQNARIIDVGTGAGFPGLVLAMARPDTEVTLMDAQHKRLSFLEAVIEKTGLHNAVVLHARAEDAAHNQRFREQFDIATARAVAPLNVLCEYLLPFVRLGGTALCWKGPSLKNELEEGRQAARMLGGRLEMPIECKIAGRDWEHRILPIRKIEKTASAYPRKAGIPKAKPLRLNNG